ncbi:acyltransferase [Actinobacteria bacterium YIM 96077]|uniref:Acyltransferase n=1 Tax=Phytoactinopolyspora halophila TaxID=1981511 RepID=A0A329QC92_9ACTN|nr:acyltransferase [Phytoactinopolyspora halophila]AYY14120.1 acyltransferase [Actinobacteria bacterium YIM 96077]RAW09944.1 acyltransferase [Phytoactinopolyspora halophila]
MSLVGGVRHAARHTPGERNRAVDLLRAFAICIVVIGHWLALVVSTDDGIGGSNALSHLGWSHPVTWFLQVMPLFFLVGGYANGTSLHSHYARGGDLLGWLLSRSERLLRPTTAFIVILGSAGLGLPLLGADPELVALAVWAAQIPLWFLAAYVSLVFLAPFLYELHRRFGLAFPAVAFVAVLVIDIARMHADVPVIGAANYLLVWLVFHQIGFAWRDGSGNARPAILAALTIGGVALLIALTAFGPYPVSMVGVPGEAFQNTSPPSFALLVLGVTQAACALLLSRRLNIFLQRRSVWTVVVGINTVILTMFLWHMGAGVVAAVTLYPTGLMPEPAVDSGEWLLLRVPWVLACAAVLAVFVGVFARIEARSAGLRKGQIIGSAPTAGRLRLPGTARRGIVVTGIAGVVLGLITIAVADPAPDYLAGLPVAGLLSYIAGAGLLRLARHHHS